MLSIPYSANKREISDNKLLVQFSYPSLCHTQRFQENKYNFSKWIRHY